MVSVLEEISQNRIVVFKVTRPKIFSFNGAFFYVLIKTFHGDNSRDAYLHVLRKCR